VDSYEQQWMTLFHQLLSKDNDEAEGKECCRVLNPQFHNYGGKHNDDSGDATTFMFRSNEGDGFGSSRPSSAGMPFVKCYSGVHYGVLFLLEEGLLFFKPPRFVHRSKLHSISCGRGSGGSRYIDLVATLDAVTPAARTTSDDADTDDEEEDVKRETLEFHSIDNGELRVLNDYINNVLTKAMERDAANSSDDDFSETPSNGGDDGGGSSDSDSDDAEVVVVEGGKSGGGGGRRRGRTQRTASKEAQKATKFQLQKDDDDGEDSDDSADYNDGSEEEDSDSSSSDDDDASTATEEDDPTPARKRSKKR